MLRDLHLNSIISCVLPVPVFFEFCARDLSNVVLFVPVQACDRLGRLGLRKVISIVEFTAKTTYTSFQKYIIPNKNSF